MIILDIPQGSSEWIEQRLWRLTASQLKNNITSTGKLSESKAALGAIDKLIAGIDLARYVQTNRKRFDDMDDDDLYRFMAHYTGEKFRGSIHTERGHEFEADALAAMSELIGNQLTPVGMCVMGDDPNGVVSCSPDALEYRDRNLVAGAEVKNPCLCTYLGYVQAGVLPDAYKLQVHASMAICEVDVWHFGAYFKDKPLFYKRVTRDKTTDMIQQSLIEFKALYQERYAEAKEKLHALETQTSREGVA